MKISSTLAVIATVGIMSSCQPGTKENKETAAKPELSVQETTPPKSVTVKTFPNDSLLTGFGYDIFMDSATKPTVHQPNIPAVAGNRGFASEEDAKKIGEYVGNKIRHNIMPPSVTTQELDSLGVR